MCFSTHFMHTMLYMYYDYSLNRFGAHKLVLSFSLPLFHIIHISFLCMWECWMEHVGGTVLPCLGTKYPCWFPCCTLKVVLSRFCFLLLLFALSSYVIFIFVLYEAINYFELNWFELNWVESLNKVYIIQGNSSKMPSAKRRPRWGQCKKSPSILVLLC